MGGEQHSSWRASQVIHGWRQRQQKHMQREEKIRILIIEDDENFRYLLRMHLSSAGYEVQAAVDGVDGGRALLAQTPHLIVSDLDMPFLDGFELLSLLKRDQATASIPVILLTGSLDKDMLARAVDLGAADFLTKPVTHEDLLASVEACLRSSSGKVS